MCGRHIRGSIRELSFDNEPPVTIAIDRFGDRLHLHLKVLDRLHVRIELRWQFAGMLLAVGFELLFVLDQVSFGLRHSEHERSTQLSEYIASHAFLKPEWKDNARKYLLAIGV